MQPTKYKRNGIPVCNVVGWKYSEKLDGVKAIFDGETLRTRAGNVFPTPKDFINELRECVGSLKVEGELYLGRGTFAETATLRTNSRSIWSRVSFRIFDVNLPDLNWKQRRNLLRGCEFTKRIRLIKIHTATTLEKLETFFKRVIEKGGEGVVIANPDAFYCEGYSNNLLKWKDKNDDEAQIIGFNVGENGTLSSFNVKFISGENCVFRIGQGLKKIERQNYTKYFKIGDVITFSYELLSYSGKPRAPIFKGIRCM